MLRVRYLTTAFIALLVILPLVLVGCGGNSTPAAPPDTGLKHIFYIMMENHARNQVIGNTTDAPYINQLASQYGTATNYFGVTHPSLPNYLAAISGDFQGIWDDCKADASVTCAPEEFVSGAPSNGQLLTPEQLSSATSKPHMFSGKNIVDQLEAHNKTWKAYMQSLPSIGYAGAYAPVDMVKGVAVPRKLYAVKHNPFYYFSDIRNNLARMQKIVPFTQFGSDITSNSVPNFVWISPDQCNDMHGVSAVNAKAVGIPNCASPTSGLDHSVIALGDKFLSTTVPQIMSSPAWKENSAIVIAWDEDDYSGFSGCCHSPVGVKGTTLGGAGAPILVVTSKGPHPMVLSDTSYNHYSLLATIENEWGLGCLANSCGFSGSNLMTKLFEP